MNNKIRDFNHLASWIEFHRRFYRKCKHVFVLCHGVFDLVHIGHIRHFIKAKSFGDILIVSVTSDHYVNKGRDRPYFNQDIRMEFLASLEMVDYVVLSDYPNAVNVIKTLKPNIYVKGNDYRVKP